MGTAQSQRLKIPKTDLLLGLVVVIFFRSSTVHLYQEHTEMGFVRDTTRGLGVKTPEELVDVVGSGDGSRECRPL